MTQAAESKGVSTPPPRVFGFWMCLALVMGNMIGSGVYLLPASLAPLGWNGVFGWLVTIAGALCLAFIFSRLARSFPRAGGPYAYSRAAFGSAVGFLVAWSYWVSFWIGNVAIATGVVAPLSTLVPGVAENSVFITVAMVWTLTLINCQGAQLVGRVQIVTTILKILPLAAVIILGIYVLGSGADLPPLRLADLSILGETGIAAAGALTLWAFLGLESATVPAEKVKDAARTISNATLAGTVLTGMIYLFAVSVVALLLPPEQAARSGAPLADFVAHYWGVSAGQWIAFFAVVSAFGALNGWILLQGEMPWAMAKDGVFPRFFAHTSKRGTPVRAHIVSSMLLTGVLMMNQSRSMGDLFQVMILLATTASVVPYFICSLAAIRLRATGALKETSLWLPIVALVGAAYALWAIWGAGVGALLPWLGLILVGAIIYALMQRSSATDETA